MASLNLKEYGDHIFVELRDTDPGCEKFHGDIATVQSMLMNRMERRKLQVQSLVSNNPMLLAKIMTYCEENRDLPK